MGTTRATRWVERAGVLASQKPGSQQQASAAVERGMISPCQLLGQVEPVVTEIVTEIVTEKGMVRECATLCNELLLTKPQMCWISAPGI
jgi:hypothetical protein